MLLALLKISSRLRCTHSRATAAPLGLQAGLETHMYAMVIPISTFAPPQVAGPDKKDHYEDVRANANSRVCLNNNAAFTGEPACASRFCISGPATPAESDCQNRSCDECFCVSANLQKRIDLMFLLACPEVPGVKAGWRVCWCCTTTISICPLLGSNTASDTPFLLLQPCWRACWKCATTTGRSASQRPSSSGRPTASRSAERRRRQQRGFVRGGVAPFGATPLKA